MTHRDMANSVLVLAGGRSRRLGRDKLRLDWRGRPLRDHVVNRMRELSDDVIVLAAHDDDDPGVALSGVRILRDIQEWPGPLVAVAAGLHAAQHERVLIVAADMPIVPIRVLGLLLSEWRHPGHMLVGLLAADELAALPVCVHRTAALEHATVIIAAGTRRLGALRDLPDVYGVPETQWRALDPHGDSLRDIDTEEDLRAIVDGLREF